MKTRIWLANAVAGLLLGSAITAEEVELEVFTGPQGKEIAQPVYPTIALRNLREGWVQMHFMVGPDGRPYEIAVTDSMGGTAFHRSAVRALEKSLFEPARLNDAPIDAGDSRKFYFQIQGNPGARGQFLTTHRAIRKAIEADDRERAGQLIDELSARNYYEDALLHLAKFNYLGKWGEPDAQLRALDRAIAHETTAKYLPEEVFIHALFAHFGLLAQTRDYHRALQAFESLSAFELDEERRAALQADAEQIRILKTDDRAYSVAGEIDDTANWYFDLFQGRLRRLGRPRRNRRSEAPLRSQVRVLPVRPGNRVSHKRHLRRLPPDPGRQPGNDIPAKTDVGTQLLFAIPALYKLHCGPGGPRTSTRHV